MGARTADPTEALPDEWDVSYAACSCGETAQRWHAETKTFYHVPCEGADPHGIRLSWPCKMAHNHAEFDAGRDPIGKGGRPFRVSAAGAWTQIGSMEENTKKAKRDGKELQRTTRTNT